jgi:hypothetical protein
MKNTTTATPVIYACALILLLSIGSAFAWQFNEECDTAHYDTCAGEYPCSPQGCIILNVPDGVCNTVYLEVCRDGGAGVYVTASLYSGTCCEIEFPCWCQVLGPSTPVVTQQVCNPFSS